MSTYDSYQVEISFKKIKVEDYRSSPSGEVEKITPTPSQVHSSYYMQPKALGILYKTNKLKKFQKNRDNTLAMTLRTQRTMWWQVTLLFLGLKYLIIEAEEARNSKKITGNNSGLSSKRIRKMGSLARQTTFIC